MMKKFVTVVMIAVAIFSGTILITINSEHFFTAKPNGGVNDPPDGTGIASLTMDRIIAINPNGGGMNDPPDSNGFASVSVDRVFAINPNGGSNDPPEGRG